MAKLHKPDIFKVIKIALGDLNCLPNSSMHPEKMKVNFFFFLRVSYSWVLCDVNFYLLCTSKQYREDFGIQYCLAALRSCLTVGLAMFLDLFDGFLSTKVLVFSTWLHFLSRKENAQHSKARTSGSRKNSRFIFISSSHFLLLSF